MLSRIRRANLRRGLRVLFAALGGLAYWLAFPPTELAAAGWLAPPCWLVAIDGLKGWRRGALIFIPTYVAFGLLLHWFRSTFGGLAFVLFGVAALYPALWGLCAGLAARMPRWGALAWPAICWTGIEYFRGELAPLCFSWLALGYSQPNTVGFGLAGLVGVYGVSGAMTLWGTALLNFLRPPAEAEGSRLNNLATVAQFIAIPAPLFVMLWGMVPPRTTPPGPVGTARLQQFDSRTDRDAFEPPREAYAKPVELTIWPEVAFHADPTQGEGAFILEKLRPVAARSRMGVIFGTRQDAPETAEAGDFHNVAFLLGPDGKPAGRAAKNQPVQLTNDGIAAEGVTILDSPTGEGPRMGVGLCYDGSFQRFAARMARGGADVLIFPTHNTRAWGAIEYRQHQRMFQMRAAETGLPLLVAAINGPTMAVGPTGRVLAELPFQATRTLDAPIAARRAGTLFNRAGHATGPLCLALTLAGLAWGAAARRRAGQAGRVLLESGPENTETGTTDEAREEARREP